MLTFQTENPLLISEREKAREYLVNLLIESEHTETMINDFINATESVFVDMEVNEANIKLAYEKIYSKDLLDALPAYLLKTKLTIVK